MKKAIILSLAFAALAMPISAIDPGRIFESVLLWPEAERAFIQDGPGLLLSRSRADELFELYPSERAAWMDAFLAEDPIPSTPANELEVGIQRRLALVRKEFVSFQDDRAKLLFLLGEPEDRSLVDCAETFKPMEIWTYSDDTGVLPLILFQPEREQPFRVWRSIEPKRELYKEEMEYWLQQWEEMKGRIYGRRIDRFFCRESERVDIITGVDGIQRLRDERINNSRIEALLLAPDDLAEWSAKAVKDAGGDSGDSSGALPTGEVELFFTERIGQRMVTRMQVALPEANTLEVFEEGDSKQLRFVLEGVLEQSDRLFEEFRVRFQIPYPEDGFDKPLALVAERRLRPGEQFLLRLRITEELTGRELFASKGLVVPAIAEPQDLPVPTADSIIALGEELARERIPGVDSLILIPPASDVVFGLWRAEALVTGHRIERVRFFVDEEQQVARKGPPFTVELRLEKFPIEQTVRAEGYDSSGELVDVDEVVLNLPRGELRVRILEPGRGDSVSGATEVTAEVVVPEEKSVAKVEFRLNDELVTTLERPPWITTVEVPADSSQLNYVTVVAHLESGEQAEDVRFLNAPDYLEEVDVNLVELYTTVTDRNGIISHGLVQEDFQVWEDERPQKISKFELVDNLPLTLGIAIDTSGSMFQSLGEAQKAAIGFLEQIITPRDRCFAVAFNSRPEILMQRTSDVGAVAERLENLVAEGSTSLHDAVVTSLYYYRGIRGRRAMVLLSDGEDTASTLAFSAALEYAKRSGVSIYTIGLKIGKADINVRRKLDSLSSETGGSSFYISEAADLKDVYAEIEKELRSQYLLAYSSDRQSDKDGAYREVKLEVKKGRLKARTIRGYYP